MKPKVSVIIPVYNVQRYLTKCIESVIKQTLSDIEIICIDDGSTDLCPKILDEYAVKDKRIKVIHKDNEGYGKAMNMGLDLAQGEYIGIVESDDYILPNMYEILYKKAKENDLDLIKSNFYFFWDILNFKKSSEKEYLSQYYNKVLTEEFREIYFKFEISNWTGIYKNDLIKSNNIRHNETPGASYQDTGFWFQVMAMCKRAMWLEDSFYMYRQDNPMSSVKNKGKMLVLNNEYDFIEKKLKDKKQYNQIKLCNYYRIRSYIATFYRIDDSIKLEFVKLIKNEFSKYKTNIVEDINKSEMECINWLEYLFSEPERICNELIQKRKEYIKKFDEANNIVVYGAGKRAERVIIKLYDLGFYNKISNVFVSGDIISNQFMNKEVKNVKDIEIYKNSLVLVAVKEDTKNYNEIVETLKSHNIYNFMDTGFVNVF